MNTVHFVTYIFFVLRNNEKEIGRLYPRYQVGEVVAIAQSYKEIGMYDVVGIKDYGQNFYAPIYAEHSAGWNNKLFVESQYMPHHIKITAVRMERLHDISEEDIIREGIEYFLRELCKDGAMRYDREADSIYWIGGEDSDPSLLYCENCAKEEVEKLNKNKADDNEEFYVDGGCVEEEECARSCEKCGKPLLFSFCGNISRELPNMDLKHDEDLYILNQVLLDGENSEIVIRHFAKEAYAALIDKISGKGTWLRNPWVMVYEFEKVD